MAGPGNSMTFVAALALGLCGLVAACAGPSSRDTGAATAEPMPAEPPAAPEPMPAEPPAAPKPMPAEPPAAPEPIGSLESETIAGSIAASLQAIDGAKVPLGGEVRLAFTVRNREADRALRVMEIARDVQSLSFEIEWGEGVRFECTKTTYFGNFPREWEVTEIAAGSANVYILGIPAIRAGGVRITAVYRGAAEFEGVEEIRVGPVAVEVAAEHPGDEVLAVLKTNFGTVKARLYADDAPNTALHFAELIRSGFYDDVTFHRLIPGFVIQGGDPEGTGSGGPGFTLAGEFNERKHTAGVLSMARTEDPDSAGSQFFICLGDAPHLDGQYTAFGEVVEGFDEVVRKMEQVETWEGTDRPSEDLFIEKATLEVAGRKP